ncbi:caltractin-like [Patiria miniata]|uniref:EF-hand domain-containing protein n=1 Tax=Patiria miniata TaxID=46514 RepID=A0A914B8N3_PATMI|nr:caltractin-like [Patiria miniata]
MEQRFTSNVEVTRSKNRTFAKRTQSSSSESETNTTDARGSRMLRENKKDARTSVDSSDAPSRPQATKQMLKNIASETKMNEVDAKIQGELTPQEVRDLKYVFDTFDNEHRGFIDADDLRRALRVMGFKVTQDDLTEMIADVNGGTAPRREVTFAQFLEVVVYKQADARDIYGDLEQGFKMMDIGEKGHLTFEDIKKASQAAGLKFRDGTIRDMMDEADTNGDDLVSKEEFFQVMLQTNLF